MTRGLRNNNPLNIRLNNTCWQGMCMEQTDDDFVQFTTMAYGYRAAWRILFTYFYRFVSQHKPFTVGNIIARWAPPTENDTEAYIKAVTRLSGLGGNESVPRPLRFWNFLDLEKTARLIASMACVECGMKMDEVNMDEVWEGYDLAFPKSSRRKKMREEREALQARDEYALWG